MPPAFDGGPDQWFTSTGLHGSNYGSLSTVGEGQALYRYPNDQEAATLWFHDHSLGTTRLNVYGGVAAFYLLRDDQDTGRGDNPLALPAGAQEVELVIQDRSFDTDGELLYFDATQLASSDVHPYWRPEFFGDVIVVNGKSWPKMEVEPRRYRLRILNGSNARFYQMTLARRWQPMVDRTTIPSVAAGIRVTERGPTFWQIGTDGGRLDLPVAMETILLAPGERADVIVDFSSAAGESLTLVNDANAPYPGGDPVDPQTTAQIMRFDVARRASAADGTCDPAAPASRAGACRLRPGNPIVRLVDPAAGALAAGAQPDERRQLILREIEGPTGPLEVLVNNTNWEGLKESSLTKWPVPVDGSIGIGAGFVTETPRVGATELWEVANLTEDAHPIHMHLVQFQVVNRQSIDTGRDDKDAPIGYLKDLLGALPPSSDPGKEPPADGPPFTYTSRNGDGAVGGNAAFSGYLTGDVSAPAPNEAGWKDTVVMYPATVTRIAVRFAPQAAPLEAARPGVNLFPFDPTLTDPARRDLFGNPGSAGYVWHCHILEHEDNDMMRPYAVRP